MATYRNGSSRSRRAEDAENAGRVPWSRLSRADRHGLTKAEAIALRLNLEEWHHVSKYANRIEYFDPAVLNEVLADLTGEAIKGAAAIATGYGLTAYHNATDEARAAQQLIQDRVENLWERMEWTR